MLFEPFPNHVSSTGAWCVVRDGATGDGRRATGERVMRNARAE